MSKTLALTPSAAPLLASRNVIAGNICDNIHIVGATAGSGNKVQGNFIGVGANGTSILFTFGLWGIEVGGVNATTITIGGTTAGARNVIGGNLEGIDIDDAARDNIIQGISSASARMVLPRRGIGCTELP